MTPSVCRNQYHGFVWAGAASGNEAVLSGNKDALDSAHTREKYSTSPVEAATKSSSSQSVDQLLPPVLENLSTGASAASYVQRSGCSSQDIASTTADPTQQQGSSPQRPHAVRKPVGRLGAELKRKGSPRLPPASTLPTSASQAEPSRNGSAPAGSTTSRAEQAAASDGGTLWQARQLVLSPRAARRLAQRQEFSGSSPKATPATEATAQKQTPRYRPDGAHCKGAAVTGSEWNIPF